MPEMTFNKKHLNAALATVTAELTDLLKTESAELSKAAKDDAPAEESEGSSEPAKSPPSDGGSAPPSDGPPADGPPAEGSAPPAEGSAPPAEGSAPPEISAAAAPEGSPQHEAGEIEPAMSVEQLQAEIMQQPPEYQKMLFLAAKAALMASMGGDQGAPPAPEASAPMAGGPPAAAPPEASAPMAMGEMGAGKQLPASPGNGGKMAKSEDQMKIEELEKHNAALTEEVGKLAAALDKLPVIRKSVKGVSDLRFIGRTDEGEKKSPVASLTKAEVTEKLKEQIRNGKLSKSDKNLVSQYTMGIVEVNAIEHLLNGAK